MTDETPSTSISVCFQFITKGGAVVDSEPEDFPSLLVATKQAEEWLNLPAGRTISFITYEGDGAVIRPDETEHVAVMPASKMAALYETYRQAAEEQAASLNKDKNENQENPS